MMILSIIVEDDAADDVDDDDDGDDDSNTPRTRMTRTMMTMAFMAGAAAGTPLGAAAAPPACVCAYICTETTE